MKKILILSAATLTLAACSSTWSGVKNDTANNIERAETGIEKGVDATKTGIEKGYDATVNAVKKGGQAVGSGLSKTGEAIENISK